MLLFTCCLQVVNQIMAESGAHIRVSGPDEVIPKSGERIVTITGSLGSLYRAQQLVTMHVNAPRNNDEAAPPNAERTLKILVPNGAAGVVIGKGGCVINELKALSGAQIRVSQPSEVIVATQERIITCVGPTPNLDAAQAAISQKLAEAPVSQQPRAFDYTCLKEVAAPPPPAYPPAYPPGYPYYAQQPYPGYPPAASAAYPGYYAQQPPPPAAPGGASALPTSGGPGSTAGDGGGGAPPRQWHQTAPPGSATGAVGPAGTTTSTMSLGNAMIAGVIGRGGSIIKDISSRSGASVKVAQKEQVNSSGERTVTIEGTPEGVQMAEHLIRERCQQVEAENSARGRPPPRDYAAPPAAPADPYPPAPGYGSYGYPPASYPGMQQAAPPPPPQSSSLGWQNVAGVPPSGTYQPGAGGSGGYQFC